MTAQARLPEVIGPYSEWPRKPVRKWKGTALVASVIVAAGVFAHCVVPMIG